MQTDARTPGRSAGERDVVRIAAKAGDVLLDPAQCRLLIQEPIVTGRRTRRVFRGERAVGEKTKRTHAIIRCDHNRAGLFGKRSTVASREVRRSSDERTGMEPDDHGRERRRTKVARPDVHEQAILGPSSTPCGNCTCGH